MAGVAWITKQIEEADSRVYVHCNAGRGRSAVVVLCYLMSTHGWTAEEAFEFVLAKRQIAKLTALCGTRPQVGFSTAAVTLLDSITSSTGLRGAGVCVAFSTGVAHPPP